MKSKYVMIGGFALSEENDMEKLKNYASQGWILEDIIGGLFYKLKKDKPQDIVYSLDYQLEANEEYFSLFKEAGWKLVLSIGNQMHIFSSQAGTKPIYSDCESEVSKYIRMKNQTKKGCIYSLILAIVLIALAVISIIAIRPIFIIIVGLFIMDIIVGSIIFQSYFAYNCRIKHIKKYGKSKSEIINNEIAWKSFGFCGVVLLILGILDLIKENYFGVIFTICGAVFIYLALKCYKKYL